MENKLESWQRSTIFSTANKLGINTSSHEDELHILVEGVSGKASIKELTVSEANSVIKELKNRISVSGYTAPPKKVTRETTPGGVTKEQQGKIWRLMYELEKYDKKPAQATIGKRLCGMIQKQCHVDAPLKQPFRFLSCNDGRELIETLRHILTSLELKRIRDGGGQS